MPTRGSALALTAAMLLAPPAVAQDTGTWTRVTDPSGEAVMAVVAYEGAPGLTAQCHAGALDLAITNLPARPAGAGGTHRPLSVEWPTGPDDAEAWEMAGGDTTVLANFAARAIRSLRNGGAVKIAVTAEGDAPAARFELPLPTTAPELDAVLTACNTPLVDDWDQLPFVDDLLKKLPSPSQYARVRAIDRALERERINYAEGTFICRVAPRGRVSECRIERQTPVGSGYGAAVVRNSDVIRLDFGDDAEAAVGGLIAITMNITIQD